MLAGLHPVEHSSPANGTETTATDALDADPSLRAGSASVASHPNPVIDAALKSGAVARASDLPPVTRFKRGPWWWRRRLIHERAPVYHSRFETEFQEMLAGVLNGEPASIDVAVPGQSRLIDDSNYYLVQFTGSDVDAASMTEAQRFARLSTWPEVASRTVLAPRRAHSDAIRVVQEAPVSHERVLFLDIETAGLSANTYLFLVGMMYANGSGFHMEQVFARDYTEEKGVLLHVYDTMSRFDTVVTYNGASFDLPFIRTRMAVHRLPELPPVGSVDLLHASRRAFRDLLPNCRLVTVEQHLRGAGRVDDIPSRFIPRAYHEFVRTKDARIMRNVAYHNRMDLFTMAVILNHLSDPPMPVPEAIAPIPVANPGIDL